MDVSTIADMSIQMSLAKAQQGIEISVVKKAMDMQSQQAEALLSNMQQMPSFGHQLDVTI